MTLKISHGAFDGMCSEFHAWRCAVAKAAGYPTTMELLDYGHTLERPAFDWDSISHDNIAGVWTAPPADPLLVLFVHSDTHGVIVPADALRLANRLTELLISAKWRKVTAKFVAGCRLASHRNEMMKFVYDPAAMVQRLIEEHLRERLAAADPGRFKVRISVMARGSTVH
jgi:hypothetical protein